MSTVKKITVYDIAQKAGVSVATVSRVINNNPKVDYTTRKRVLDICREQNYYPTERKKAEYVNIGVVINKVSDPSAILSDYVLGILHGALEYCQSNDATLSILTFDAEAMQHPELFVQKLLARGIQGVFFINPKVNAPWVETLCELGFPCACVGSYFSNPLISSINIDNREGIRLAIEHLRELGHRKIGYVAIQSVDYDATERHEAFVAYMGREADPDTLIMIKPDGGDHRKATSQYFDRKLPALEGRLPEAFVCLNDSVATGLIHALRKRGIQVPEDVSVVGYDDYSASMYHTPTITTIRNPVLKTGSLACSNVAEAIAGNRSVLRRLIIPKLIKRESTAKRV